MKVFVSLLLLTVPFWAAAQTVNLDSLVAVTQRMKDDTTKAFNLLTISNKYRVEKINYANAKKYAQEAIDLSRKINWPKGIFKSTIAFAYVIRDMGLNPEGIELLKKALGIFEGSKELCADASLFITHIYTYTAIADLYTYLPDYANAQKNAFKALELSEKYQMGIGQCWITLSIIFSKQKNLQEANAYALKALDYFKERSQWDDLARTYAFLARYAYTAEDYSKAIVYYQSSYGAYQKANSLFGMRIALYNLSEINLKIKDYEKADYYIDETLKINSVSNDDVIYSFYISQLKFEISLNKKNYEEATKVGSLMLSYATKEKNLKNISAASGNLLAVYMAMKDTAKAFVMSEKISNLKDSLYNADMAKSTADLAKKYETEKKEQQILFLDKENRLKQEKLNKETLLFISLKNENALKEGKLYQEHLLAEALERENGFKDHQLEQELAIKKGLEKVNALRLVEFSQETLLNQTLQSQNKLMRSNSRNESIIRWLMTAALIGFTAFGVNYYRSYKRQKLDNDKIVKQSEELKVLMKEVHHRVKNNLQIVVSMLRMQARSIEDKIAIDALANSENRMQTIAMVHEKLYRSNSHGEVLLQEYLQELIDVLQKQHQHKHPNLSCSVKDHTQLITNMDTAIPLGLIVNELVTNSLKYAFATTEKPEINIQLDKTSEVNYQLTIKDNGQGLPNGKLPEPTTSLGLKLVKLFTEQLNGSLAYATDNGSCFNVSFKASAIG